MRPIRSKNRKVLLPVFDGIARCASATGIPSRILKQAKAAGCPGFRSGRVHLSEVLPWLFAQPDATSATNWRDELARWQSRRQELKALTEESTLIRKTQVIAALNEIFGSALARIEQKLVNEYPSAVAGLDVPQARIYGKRIVDDIRTAFRDLAGIWEGQ